MKAMRPAILFLVAGIFISSCITPTTNTPIVPTVTSISIVITATSLPSSTPDLKGWETPPSEVLLLYDPTKPLRNLPPAAKYTETVAERKFQFANPTGFKFRDTSYSSLMENKEKSIMISLELFQHKGKANAAGFLGVVLDDKMYEPTGEPEAYNLAGYKGWIVGIESPAIYDNGIGQLIVVDIDASNLFYAIGLAKHDQWESNGKQVFAAVISSVTFPGFQ